MGLENRWVCKPQTDTAGDWCAYIQEDMFFALWCSNQLAIALRSGLIQL